LRSQALNNFGAWQNRDKLELLDNSKKTEGCNKNEKVRLKAIRLLEVLKDFTISSFGSLLQAPTSHATSNIDSVVIGLFHHLGIL